MRYQQLSLFDTKNDNEIRTVEDFVDADYAVYKDCKRRGWIPQNETYAERINYYFMSYCGGSCPSEFAGYDFFDYSPQGVRLQKFGKEYKELKFSKAAILAAIKRGDYRE